MRPKAPKRTTQLTELISILPFLRQPPESQDLDCWTTCRWKMMRWYLLNLWIWLLEFFSVVADGEKDLLLRSLWLEFLRDCLCATLGSPWRLLLPPHSERETDLSGLEREASSRKTCFAKFSFHCFHLLGSNCYRHSTFAICHAWQSKYYWLRVFTRVFRKRHKKAFWGI